MPGSDRNRVTLRRGSTATVIAALAGIAAWATAAPASAQSQGKIPELASSDFAWLAFGADWRGPPAGMRGPIHPDPDHPYHGNVDGPGQVTPRLGNYKDPILKPWAAAQMRESNEQVLRGERSIPFAAQHRCYPGGVPGQLLFPAAPFYFIQTPKEVWMIWQRDHMVRRIYLTDKHSDNVKPSWFGESIGHYENGDTLVIDTIGFRPRPATSITGARRIPRSCTFSNG